MDKADLFREAIKTFVRVQGGNAALANLLPLTHQASVPETVALIDREALFGLGCGLIDLQLLASTLITPNAAALAQRFGVAHRPHWH
jgi:hypothetical protein